MRTLASSSSGRRGERGAALFIVLMVITLLTAIGVFSARAASLVDVASGYNRQAVQTLYVTEYGSRTVASEFGSGTAESIFAEMARGAESCVQTANVVPAQPGAKVPCYRLFLTDLAARIDTNFAGQKIFDQASLTAPGSLGPKLVDATQTPLSGTFIVEITDPGPPTAPLAGSDAGGTGTSFVRRQVTITGTGQTRPFVPANVCDDAASAAAGVQSLRAYVTLPPMPGGG